jgi:hypothetical protein
MLCAKAIVCYLDSKILIFCDQGRRIRNEERLSNRKSCINLKERKQQNSQSATNFPQSTIHNPKSTILDQSFGVFFTNDFKHIFGHGTEVPFRVPTPLMTGCTVVHAVWP